MVRAIPATLALLLALSVAFAPGARAHDGHVHRLLGVVTMAAADHVMLKTTEGKDATVLVTKDTKVTRDKQAIKAQDIAVGARVVIALESEQEPLKAKEIQVGASAKPAAATS
jgi:hypothetical protein